MSNGQASILTESQRQYVKDGTKLSGGPVSNASEYDKNIRKRLARALIDMRILYENLEQDELREVFSKRYAETEELRDNKGESHGWYCSDCDEHVESINHDCPAREYESNWYSTAPGAFAFLAWALNVGDDPIYPPYQEAQPALENFSNFAEQGISDYLLDKHNLSANVTVSIEISDVDRADELYPEEK